MFRLAHGAVRLVPSQNTLDHFGVTLRYVVVLVPGGSSVQGRLARLSSLRAISVDGEVRRDVLRPQAVNGFFNILGLVLVDRDACRGRCVLLQHLLRCRAPAIQAPRRPDRSCVPSWRVSWSSGCSPCPRSCGRGGCRGRSCFRACRSYVSCRGRSHRRRLYRPSAWRCMAGPRLDQRAVDGEMIVR